VSRCPACGLPVHSLRTLFFVVGIAGVFVLLFVVLLMFKLAKNEEAARAPAPGDENVPEQQELFAAPPPPKSSSEYVSPEKRPPLDEH
jgi:hypothetical protein